MKYEKALWITIVVLLLTVTFVQTDRYNQAQARVADLEMGVK